MLSNPLNDVFSLDFQLNNLWDFWIDDPIFTTVRLGKDLRLRVKETNLPLPKLTTQKLTTGQKVYIGREHVDEYTITVYETSDFKTYDYFKSWLDNVFDEKKMQFVAYERGMGELNINRTAFLQFNKFQEAGVIPSITTTPIPNFVEIPTKTFKYNSCKIMSISDYSVSYSEGSPLEYTITITFDNVEII